MTSFLATLLLGTAWPTAWYKAFSSAFRLFSSASGSSVKGREPNWVKAFFISLKTTGPQV